MQGPAPDAANLVIESSCPVHSGQGASEALRFSAQGLMTNTNGLSERIEAALDQQRLWDGQVVRSASSENSPTPCWYFCTKVATDVLELLQAERISAVMTSDAIGIGPRFTFWVVALQVRAIQHRFFLPLVAPSVGALVADMSREDLHLLMDAGPSVPALNAHVPVRQHLRATLATMHQPVFDREVVLRDVILTAASLLDPGALKPANPRSPPTSVSVTAVLPTELVPDGRLFGA